MKSDLVTMAQDIGRPDVARARAQGLGLVHEHPHAHVRTRARLHSHTHTHRRDALGTHSGHALFHQEGV